MLDVVHVECNVSNSVLKDLFGECDTLEVRRNMKEAGVKQNLWFHRDPQGVNYVKLLAPYVFT